MSDDKNNEMDESKITTDVSKDGMIVSISVPAEAREEEEKRPKKVRPISYVRSSTKFENTPELITSYLRHFDESGKAVVGSPTRTDRIRGVPHEFDFDLYEALYKTEALVFRGINITANHVMQPGFVIEGGSEKNRNIIQAWVEYIGLDIIFHDLIRSLLMFGDSFYEIIINNPKTKNNHSEFVIEHLKAIPPGTMFVYRTESGDVIGYVQIPKTRRFFRGNNSYLKTRALLSRTLKTYGTKDELDTEAKRGWKGFVRDSLKGAIPFYEDEILHIKNNDLPGGEYGISVMEPMMTALTIYEGMRLDISVIAKRYASPKILWTIGDEDKPASDPMLSEFMTYINQSNIGDDIVVPSWISFSVLGAGEVSMDMVPYMDILRRDVFASLSVPEILMGGGSSSNAAAKIELEAFSRRGVILQKMLSFIARRNIFPRVIGIDDKKMTVDLWNDIPRMTFRPMITEEEKYLRAHTLFDSNIISREEARRLLGMSDEPEGHMALDDKKELEQTMGDIAIKTAKAMPKITATSTSSTKSTSGAGARGPTKTTGGGGDDKKKAQGGDKKRAKNQGGRVGESVSEEIDKNPEEEGTGREDTSTISDNEASDGNAIVTTENQGETKG